MSLVLVLAGSPGTEWTQMELLSQPYRGPSQTGLKYLCAEVWRCLYGCCLHRIGFLGSEDLSTLQLGRVIAAHIDIPEPALI